MPVAVIETKFAKIYVTFDEEPFAYLPEKQQPSAKERIAILQKIASIPAAKAIASSDIIAKKYTQRIHVLIRSYEDDVYNVFCCDDVQSYVAKIELTASGKAKEKSARQAHGYEVDPDQVVLKDTSTIIDMPTFPDSMTNYLHAEVRRLEEIKNERLRAVLREQFLAKGPQKMPEKIAYPELTTRMDAKTKLDATFNFEVASKLFSDEYVKQTGQLLAPRFQEIESRYTSSLNRVGDLRTKFNEVAALRSSLSAKIKKMQAIPAWALFLNKSHQDVLRMVGEVTTAAEAFLRSESANLITEYNYFIDQFKNEYNEYCKNYQAFIFTRHLIIAAIYNSAIDYYDYILKDTEKDAKGRAEKIKELNSKFAGLVSVDDATGEMTSVTELSQLFANASLNDLKERLVKWLKDCDTSVLSIIFTSDKLKKINGNLNLARKHAVAEFKKFYINPLKIEKIYVDTKEDPFRFDSKDFVWNLALHDLMKKSVSHIADPEKLKGILTALNYDDKITAQEADLTSAKAQLTVLQKQLDAHESLLKVKSEAGVIVETIKTHVVAVDKSKVDIDLILSKLTLDGVPESVQALYQLFKKQLDENRLFQTEGLTANAETIFKALDAINRLASEPSLEVQLAEHNTTLANLQAISNSLAAKHSALTSDVAQLQAYYLLILDHKKLSAAQKELADLVAEVDNKYEQMSKNYKTVDFAKLGATHLKWNYDQFEKKYKSILEIKNEIVALILKGDAKERATQLDGVSHKLSKLKKTSDTFKRLYVELNDAKSHIHEEPILMVFQPPVRPPVAIVPAPDLAPPPAAVAQQDELIDYRKLIDKIWEYIKYNTWKLKGLFYKEYEINMSNQRHKHSQLPRFVSSQWRLLSQFYQGPMLDPKQAYLSIRQVALDAIAHPNKRRTTETWVYYHLFNKDEKAVYEELVKLTNPIAPSRAIM